MKAAVSDRVEAREVEMAFLPGEGKGEDGVDFSHTSIPRFFSPAEMAHQMREPEDPSQHLPPTEIPASLPRAHRPVEWPGERERERETPMPIGNAPPHQVAIPVGHAIPVMNPAPGPMPAVNGVMPIVPNQQGVAGAQQQRNVMGRQGVIANVSVIRKEEIYWIDPLSGYNYMIQQYNEPCNIANGIALSYVKTLYIYPCIFSMIACRSTCGNNRQRQCYQALLLLLLYMWPFVNVFMFVLNSVAFAIFLGAVVTKMRNAARVPNIFINMYCDNEHALLPYTVSQYFSLNLSTLQQTLANSLVLSRLENFYLRLSQEAGAAPYNAQDPFEAIPNDQRLIIFMAYDDDFKQLGGRFCKAFWIHLVNMVLCFILAVNINQNIYRN